MEPLKGVHPDAGKEVAEVEVYGGRGIEAVGTQVMPREFVKKEKQVQCCWKE